MQMRRRSEKIFDANFSSEKSRSFHGLVDSTQPHRGHFQADHLSLSRVRTSPGSGLKTRDKLWARIIEARTQPSLYFGNKISGSRNGFIQARCMPASKVQLKVTYLESFGSHLKFNTSFSKFNEGSRITAQAHKIRLVPPLSADSFNVLS